MLYHIHFICIGPIPDEFKRRTYKSQQWNGRGVSFEFYKMLYLRETVEYISGLSSK